MKGVLILPSQTNEEPQREQELRQAALELFARKGYHNTKISEVVKAAGVSQGTFYWYFDGKEQMAIRLVENGRDKLVEVIEQGYRKHAGSVDDMVNSSANLLTNLFEFANENRNLMAFLLIKGQGADPKVRSVVSEVWIAFEEAFKKNVLRAIELGMLPQFTDVSLRVNILVSLITGVLTKWLFGPLHDVDYKPVYTASQIAEETARFEFRGLLG